MTILIKDAVLVTENGCRRGSLLVCDGIIHRIYYETDLIPEEIISRAQIVEAQGWLLFPGLIDDHVHFREPGQEEKACIATESRAALLGGITTYLDMPNNRPPVTTLHALATKYAIAARDSAVHYGFYLGATDDNMDQIRLANTVACCGIKVFMGSSTGNMLVEKTATLEHIFKESPLPVAVHCEEESVIRANLQQARELYGNAVPVSAHPQIRSREACILSTRKAIDLALCYGTRLHILHLSTAEEVEMLASARKQNPNITGEACVHHLWFTEDDYERLGNLIKCNPAIKTASDREALRQGVREGVISVVGTDHAPHTLAEKQRPYLEAPSGIPMIQHSLLMMWELCTRGIFSPQDIARTMAAAPARLFGLTGKGQLKEGYDADLVLLNPAMPLTVSRKDLASRCAWSPLEGHTFPASIARVFLSSTPASSSLS